MSLPVLRWLMCFSIKIKLDEIDQTVDIKSKKDNKIRDGRLTLNSEL